MASGILVALMHLSTGTAWAQHGQPQYSIGMHLRRGKAILPWTPTPDEAVAATCHVNHKYALDGCDPCSYGGILWCFGLFDKPMGEPLFELLYGLPCIELPRSHEYYVGSLRQLTRHHQTPVHSRLIC